MGSKPKEERVLTKLLIATPRSQDYELLQKIKEPLTPEEAV